MIGDSGEQDLQIYRRLYDTANFKNRIGKILIRHVPGTPLQKTLHSCEYFYREISELKAQIDECISWYNKFYDFDLI